MKYKIQLIPPLSKTSSVLNGFYIKAKEILMYCEMRGDDLETTKQKLSDTHKKYVSNLTDKRLINNFTISFEIQGNEILIFDDWGGQGNIIIKIN